MRLRATPRRCALVSPVPCESCPGSCAVPQAGSATIAAITTATHMAARRPISNMNTLRGGFASILRDRHDLAAVGDDRVGRGSRNLHGEGSAGLISLCCLGLGRTAEACVDFVTQREAARL